MAELVACGVHGYVVGEQRADGPTQGVQGGAVEFLVDGVTRLDRAFDGEAEPGADVRRADPVPGVGGEDR